MDEIKKRLREILINDLKIQGIEPEDIIDSAPLFGDGMGLDSLDAVELVVLIQRYFGVQILDMEQGRVAFASLDSLARFIQENRPQDAAPHAA